MVGATYPPEVVRHDPNLDVEVRGRSGVRKFGEMMHAGISEIGFDISAVATKSGKVRIETSARRRGDDALHKVAGGVYTYVAVGEQGRPTKQGLGDG